jgi:hypothetical protein
MKKIKRGTLYQRIVDWLPEVVFEEYRQKTTCIPASYHALEILQHAGIRARLQCVDAVAMNAQFFRWKFQSDPYAPMPPDAWSVGVTHANPDETGFLSHLVVVSKGVLIDCSAGQLSRPERGMTIPSGLWVKPHAPLAKGYQWQQGSALVTYLPSPERVPPMWRLDPAATARVRERIRREIIRGRFG